MLRVNPATDPAAAHRVATLPGNGKDSHLVAILNAFAQVALPMIAMTGEKFPS